MISNSGKPQWLKILPPTKKYEEIKQMIRKTNLHTVCEESHCPNMSECWSGGTATFMVMGDTCTRACKFCAVKTGFPAKELDPEEPIKLANLVKEWRLDYIVITSVDRDDLKDQGSNHFARCITEIKKSNPDIIVEVLIPDFRGNKECIKTIIDAGPDVISHNIETVESLQKKVRDPRANYKQSLFVLRTIKELNKKIFTKSSIILGLGEKEEEVVQTMNDLREINVDIITLGQYLKPSLWNLNVEEYVHPDTFEKFKEKAEELGFLYCVAGPFVRSSYKAGEFFIRSMLRENDIVQINS